MRETGVAQHFPLKVFRNHDVVLDDSRKLSIVLANPSIVSMVLSIVFT